MVDGDLAAEGVVGLELVVAAHDAVELVAGHDKVGLIFIPCSSNSVCLHAAATATERI